MAQFNDRLIFDTVTLPNGVVLHGKRWDVPFVDMRIIVPLGHAHCVNTILPGAAHLLEHCICHRSAKFPTERGFLDFLTEHGGHHDALTALMMSSYQAAIPSAHWRDAFAGLLCQVFEPVITEEIIGIERKTLGVERGRRARWYPGDNELDQYLATQWLIRKPVELRHLFGDDIDRTNASVESMYKVHRLYLTQGVHIFVGGSFDMGEALRMAGDLPPLASQKPPWHLEPIRWNRTEYHEKRFDDTARFEYFTEAIIGDLSLEEHTYGSILSSALGNFAWGTLYQWLRHERGLVYDIHIEANDEPMLAATWGLHIPLGLRQHVNLVRAELMDRIRATAFNDDMMLRVIRRRLATQAFDLQRIGDVMKTAIESVRRQGVIVTESRFHSALHALEEPSVRRDIFERLWGTAEFGEFLAIPASA